MNRDLVRDRPDVGRHEGPEPSENGGRLQSPLSRSERRRTISRISALKRRRLTAVIAVALLGLFIWTAFSLGGALLNPALGSSFSSRFAEWGREHGGASIVNWVEKEWYSHHAPPVGGKPPAGSIRVPHGVDPPLASGPAHLPVPPAITPVASPAIAGEGEWSPAGRLVGGIPAIYVTTLRPDVIHTSYVVGVAWMDTKLLKATLYSGSQIPGHGPFKDTAPIPPAASDSLVAAFNAGFLESESNGGYFTQGRLINPLRIGAASVVIYRDGSVTVGQWGRDATMTPDVVSVRQNLDLLVDNGQPVPGIDAADTTKWGFTLGAKVFVSRSGLGETADGALVYVGGPGLNALDLANLLVRAGAVRGMELDINTDWVNYSIYKPASPHGPASGLNGAELLPTMTGTPARYFQTWWARDFFTMSAAAGG